MLKRYIFLILLLGATTCQGNTFDQRFQWWTNFRLLGSIHSSKFVYFVGVDSRLFNKDGLFDQELYLGSFGYRIRPTVIIWQVYTLKTFRPNGLNRTFFENRISQQLNWTVRRSSSIIFLIRSILEERKVNNFSRWNWRQREAIDLVFPKLLANKYDLFLSEEAFFNLNHPAWVSRNSFEQNRLIAAIGFPASKNTILLVGYLNRILLLNNRTIMDHAFYVSIRVNTFEEPVMDM